MRMGSACCVIARDRTLPNRISSEALHSNIGYSPLWSCQWDNQGHVAGEVENHPSRYSHGSIGNAGLEAKDGIDVECEDISYGGSQLENFQTPMPQKTPIHGATGNLTTLASDLSFGSNFSSEVKDIQSSAIADPLVSKPSLSIPSTSSLSISKADPLSSQSHVVPADSTPSRWTHHSPGRKLFRQVSDNGILDLKSPNNFVPKGRQSFATDGGSNKLMASSQRERWSFDSDALDSCCGKLPKSNTGLLAAPIIDMQTCGVCSKLLTEKSSWSSHKIIASNELSVVAVLVCGHVYHAECLENMTSQTNRYDPPCLVCALGEKHALKMSGKALRTETELKMLNRISRNRVLASKLDGGCVVSDSLKCTEREGKSLNMGSSSSMRNVITRPFLSRHFSFGQKSAKTILENESARMTKRNGIFARYR